jgi:hypothetical protein
MVGVVSVVFVPIWDGKYCGKSGTFCNVQLLGRIASFGHQNKRLVGRIIAVNLYMPSAFP